MKSLFITSARSVTALILCMSMACSNGHIDQQAIPDGGFINNDSTVTTTDGSPCDPGTSPCGSICCLAGEICYGEQCLVPGNPCQMHSDCPYGHFCDPVLQVCLPQEAAFCQYRPPVGKLSPTVEWTWTGSEADMPDHFDVLDRDRDGLLGEDEAPRRPPPRRPRLPRP